MPAMARSSARGPGRKASTSTSTSPRRRSASTWSRTKIPRWGAASVGHMFVTTRARTTPSVLSSQSGRTLGTNACGGVPLRRRPSPEAPPHGAAGAATTRRSMVHRLYEWQGRTHAALARLGRDTRGQGTVEYVGLILLVAVILAGVVKASGGLKDSTIAEAVIKKLKGAIDSVGEGK